MPQKDENLVLWKEVEKTDVTQTKKVSIGTYSYTAIDATYQFKKATGEWGKYGETWGLKESDMIFDAFDQSGLVILKAMFFYPSANKEVSFPIHNSIKAITHKTAKNTGEKYTTIDEDFAKKLETNTVSKALSKLGFSADVYLGKFDDFNYVEGLKAEQEIDSIEEGSTAMKEKRDEFFEWCKKEIAVYASLTNATSINSTYNIHTKKAAAKCDLLRIPYQDVGEKEGIVTKFNKAKNEALQRINQSK